jgi:shikimate kinase
MMSDAGRAAFPDRHLALVGLMGSGKSTVGARCAQLARRSLVGVDELVVALAGRSIPELFAEGEARFRAVERDAVESACASPAPLVIACGGGVPLDPENRRRLRSSSFVVWLRAAPEVLAARVGDDANRPLLAGDPLGALRRQEATRADAYEAVADAVVDASAAVEAVADAVLTRFAESSAVEPGAVR